MEFDGLDKLIFTGRSSAKSPFDNMRESRNFIAKVEEAIREMNIYLDPREVTSLETLLLMEANAEKLVEYYERHNLDVPERLSGQLAQISREINFRAEGELQRKLRKLKALYEADMKPSDRRKKRAEEITALEKRLA